VAVEGRRLERALRELIAALDHRVPRPERAGERSIARDAAALRAKALTRLAELDKQEATGSGTRRKRASVRIASPQRPGATESAVNRVAGSPAPAAPSRGGHGSARCSSDGEMYWRLRQR
jgi:hypothetical protein